MVEWEGVPVWEQRLPKCKGYAKLTEGLCGEMLCLCIYVGEEGLLYRRIDILNKRRQNSS